MEKIEELKPLKDEIEKFLSNNTNFEKNIIKHISNLIVEVSQLRREKDKVYVVLNKEKLEGLLTSSLIEKIPDKFSIDFNPSYIIGMAIRDEQEKQMSKMDELIKEIKEIYDMREEKDIEKEAEEKALELFLYTDKIPEEIRLQIIERIARLNKKIRQLDKRVQVSTEKFYKDPLTGFFSNKFYDEFISDSVVMKRTDDVLIYKPFLKNINQIKDKALMFVDFANFKLINEIVGHNEADKILVKFAKMFKDDKNIIPIRRGGDEFVFIADKSTLLKYKQKMENFNFLTKYLNTKELLSNSILTFPSAGIVSLSEIDKYKEENIKSLDEINTIKKHLSSLVKKAEALSNENKILLKIKFNQPLSREEGMQKVKEIKKNRNEREI